MSDVRAYAASAEREILRVFALHEVLVASYGCKQGPHTLTYALRLVQNTRAQLEGALKLAPNIEGAIMDTPVRMLYRSGYIYVEIPSPIAVAVKAPHLRGEGLAVPIGLTASRNVRGVDFGNPATAHMVIVAGSGRGKTTAARTILYGLARQNDPAQVRLVVCTFKPKDWKAFEGLPHTVTMAVEPKEITKILRWAKEEVYRRSRAGIDSPHYIIVLDDMYNWGRIVDVGEEIGQIASLGRASGINLVISTQKVTAEGVGNNSAAIANINTRLVLGANSGPEAAQVTGKKGTGAELLGRYPGDALLIGIGAPVRIACASVEDSDVAGLGTGLRSYVSPVIPWADLEGGGSNQAGPQAPPGKPQTLLTVSLDTVSSDFGMTATAGAQEEEEPALLLPLERIDPPTEEQVRIIAEVFRQTGGSINKTVERCYGGKGTKTLGLVNNALERAGVRRREGNQ